MSSNKIFYKFKSALTYDSVFIDTENISVGSLKQIIIRQKSLPKTNDVLLENVQTGHLYHSDKESIPKNSSILVRRVPCNAPSYVSKEISSITAPIANPTTEKEKIEEAMRQVDKMIPDGTESKPATGYSYVCRRCNRPGHYIKQCPTIGDPSYDPIFIRKAHGIPKDQLQTIAQPQKGAVATHDGSMAIYKIRESDFAVKSSKPSREVPTELQCGLCRKILCDAVEMPCCKTNYCNDCITVALSNDSTWSCPHCMVPGQSLDNLRANEKVRIQVDCFHSGIEYKPSVIEHKDRCVNRQDACVKNCGTNKSSFASKREAPYNSRRTYSRSTNDRYNRSFEKQGVKRNRYEVVSVYESDHKHRKY